MFTFVTNLQFDGHAYTAHRMGPSLAAETLLLLLLLLLLYSF